MIQPTSNVEIVIPRKRTLRIRDAQGVALRVVEGTLWVTQEHDTRDAVVTAGGQFVLDRQGLALAFACDETRLEFVMAERSRCGVQAELGGGYGEYARSVARAVRHELLRSAWAAVHGMWVRVRQLVAGIPRRVSA